MIPMPYKSVPGSVVLLIVSGLGRSRRSETIAFLRCYWQSRYGILGQITGAKAAYRKTYQGYVYMALTSVLKWEHHPPQDDRWRVYAWFFWA
jgi:hypothetical protein